MESEGGTSAAERITYGHRLCTARRPKGADLEALVAFFGRENARFTADPAAARAVLGKAQAAAPDDAALTTADEAALTMVANVLLNLDDTITRE
jgi:hypothetical protein